MGLCRIPIFSCSCSPLVLPHSSSFPSFLGRPRTISLSFPDCPLQYSNFATLPLLLKTRYLTSNTNTPSASSSSSTMEAPPQGYRRNVGICLINDSKKVTWICFCLLYSIYLYFCAAQRIPNFIFCFPLLQIFSASRLDIPSAWQMPQVIIPIDFWFISLFLFYYCMETLVLLLDKF